MRWFWRELAGAGALAGVAGFSLALYAQPGVDGLLLGAPLAGLLWSAVQTLSHPEAVFPKIVLAIPSLLTFGSFAGGLYLMRYSPY